MPATSTLGADQSTFTRTTPLNHQEVITPEGKLIESTLPFIHGVNQALDFNRPKKDLPAWQNRAEFLKKLDGSRLLIVKAPTGSGKTTITALVAQALPKRFGRICCTHVRRATTQGVCSGKRMWGFHPSNKIVGFNMALKSLLNGIKKKLEFCFSPRVLS